MQRFLAVVCIALLCAVCTRSKETPAPVAAQPQFHEVTFDPFPGMDFQGRDDKLTEKELQGRIVWNLWSGDNASFWSWLTQRGFGTADLLKVVASPRDRRFQTYGIFNQPGYMRPASPDRYGLTIDVPRNTSYDFDSRIDLATYGRSSGVMGLRLFPNPNFDPAKWDAQKYWNDPNYANDPKLERPYLVGMACSFCHLGADPINPPKDPNEPEYANLSDYVGQHYLKVSEVFAHELPRSNFVKQLLLTNPPGTLDTSFIATDYLNNPGTMNGIYEIAGRMSVATPEKFAGGTLHLKNLDPRVPRVLKDGADSVGIHAALSRVYVNIGTYWQDWTRHFTPLIGIKPQSPIRVIDAQRNSPYWNWSESHAPALAAYFLRVAKPHHLADTPEGRSKHLKADAATLERGKRVFARNCAGCHSSKSVPHSGLLPADFLDGNFLGSEKRYPVTKIQTNAARAVARNALRGHIWDNFSSETYKTLPAVGDIEVFDPFTRKTKPWTVPAGGRGYYRPPSLISVWSSAPLLHHNVIGKHVHGVSVDERMEAFNDAITKLLWPKKRENIVWRTSDESWLNVPESYLQGSLLAERLRATLQTDPNTGARYFAFGPIPQRTPVNLLANADLELDGVAKAAELVRLMIHTAKVLKDVRQRGLTGDAATKELMKLVPDLYRLNACPDFVEDRGHYFGTDLSDDEKHALIEFVKTF